MALKIRSVRWDGFRIPFVQRFGTARGPVDGREGFVLRLTTDAGIAGLGEASPLPSFSGETVDAVRQALPACEALVGLTVEEVEGWLANHRDLPAALRCGIDLAACDALARHRQISVAELLGGHRRSIPVNVTLAASDLPGLAEAARAGAARGFTCFKLKVGTAVTAIEEIERIALVRAEIGNAQLRLDANGAWEVEQAIDIIRAAEPYDLELVEQPVPADDVESMVRVRRAVRTPIAADEAITGIEQARTILDAGAADVLIVKPMVIGGLRPALQILELAEEAGKRAVVTTTVDAGIGTVGALHLAARLTEPLACGLATGSLLAADLIIPEDGAGEPGLPVHSGMMGVPGRPGLGVQVDEGELEQAGTGVQGEVGP